MTRPLVAAVVLVVLGATPAVAGGPTDRLRTFVDRANRIILAPETDGGLDERLSAVRALVSEIFDFEGAAALALGRHWETLPPPARAAFTRLYADVVERAYLAWVGSKARVGGGCQHPLDRRGARGRRGHREQRAENPGGRRVSDRVPHGAARGRLAGA